MTELQQEWECDVVRDLLPLYHDGVCSGKSRALVEEHVKSCEACGKMLRQLDEDAAEREFVKEGQDVLKRHEWREKTLAVKTGIVLAGLLMLPVLIALLVTLAGHSDGKTDAVLIASMLLVAGMTVVPLVSKTKKLSKTILCSTAALLLVIFFTEMFFDDGGLLRFGEIACSTLFGLSLALAPAVVYQAKLPETLCNQKGLLLMGWDTLWFYLMLLLFAIEFPGAAGTLFGIGTFCAVLAWAVFAVIRYARIDAKWKACLVTALVIVWTVAGMKMGIVTISIGGQEILLGALG